MTKTLNSLDMASSPQDTRVVVAMSGGVDSSVVAAMLAAESYDVVGVTLQLYDHGEALHRKGACCAGQDIHDARQVAERLGIPHYVLNYEDRFRQSVIDQFADSYIAGETPVPCIACNQTVKFSDLLQTARDLGASVLATGHYVRSGITNEKRALFRSADLDRDQSYFLFATTQDQIDFLRFPLGDLEKREVRELAHKFGLSVADKHDSQDICFVPQGRYSDVIRRLRPEAGKAGDIAHMNGEILGRHEGIIHYTIGQRRGLGVATGDPLYVVRIEAETQRVIVGPRSALEVSRIDLRDINWVGPATLDEIGPAGLDIFVKVRSSQPARPARIMNQQGQIWVELAHSELGVSPGQACVIYSSGQEGAQLLGGGWVVANDHMQSMPNSKGSIAQPLLQSAGEI